MKTSNNLTTKDIKKTFNNIISSDRADKQKIAQLLEKVDSTLTEYMRVFLVEQHHKVKEQCEKLKDKDNGSEHLDPLLITASEAVNLLNFFIEVSPIDGNIDQSWDLLVQLGFKNINFDCMHPAVQLLRNQTEYKDLGYTNLEFERSFTAAYDILKMTFVNSEVNDKIINALPKMLSAYEEYQQDVAGFGLTASSIDRTDAVRDLMLSVFNSIAETVGFLHNSTSTGNLCVDPVFESLHTLEHATVLHSTHPSNSLVETNSARSLVCDDINKPYDTRDWAIVPISGNDLQDTELLSDVAVITIQQFIELSEEKQTSYMKTLVKGILPPERSQNSFYVEPFVTFLLKISEICPEDILDRPIDNIMSNNFQLFKKIFGDKCDPYNKCNPYTAHFSDKINELSALHLDDMLLKIDYLLLRTTPAVVEKDVPRYFARETPDDQKLYVEKLLKEAKIDLESTPLPYKEQCIKFFVEVYKAVEIKANYLEECGKKIMIENAKDYAKVFDSYVNEFIFTKYNKHLSDIAKSLFGNDSLSKKDHDIETGSSSEFYNDTESLLNGKTSQSLLESNDSNQSLLGSDDGA